MSAPRRRRPGQPRGNRRVSRAPAPRPRKRARAILLATVALVSTAIAGSLGRFLSTSRPGIGRGIEIWWPSDDPARGTALLAALGIVDSPRAFRFVLAVTSPMVHPEPGPHLLRDDLSPAEVLRRLARLSSRERVRVVVPEGFNRFQIAERLESSSVCSRRAFDAASTDVSALSRLGISGDSDEGYLFPATYELFADTPAGAVVYEMVSTLSARLATIRSRNVAAFQNLAVKYQWGDREILTLASMVEREAARAEERATIASVFFNRLDSVEFKPQRMLQSDPTAWYGCALHAELESCRGASGRVTPEMLRDGANAYNTYRHAGLPPGPIANPGEASIAAVLAPASTDFLFFVASGDGRHSFSRTLQEHEAIIQKTAVPRVNSQ